MSVPAKRGAAALVAMLLGLVAVRASADTFTWVAEAAGNASNQANWLQGGDAATRLPGAGDAIVLDATSDRDMTWDAGINDLSDTVASWTQTEDYTGTVTFQTVYGATGFTNFTITGEGVVSNGVWRHLANSNSEQYRLRISVGGGLTVGPSARIDASGRGYTRWNGPGGHGGRREADQHTYGSCLEPTSLGSHQTAQGGGAVYLTVGGEARVDGQILATGVYDYYGPSHGGSIYLRAGSLSGSGTNSVRGGEIAVNGVGGGGGRLAVILTQSDDFGDVVNMARGGIRASGQGYDASAGTVYLEGQSESGGGGRLIIDNSSRPHMNRATDIYGSHPTLAVTNDLRRVTLIVTNRTRVALTHDVALGYLTVAGADAHIDLQGRTLSVYPRMNLNGAFYGMGTYTTNQLGGTVVDSVGEGKVQVLSAVDNAGGATGVSTTSATLNGNLYYADESTALFVLWGTTDAGSDVSQWAHTNTWPAPVSVGAFSTNLMAPELVANTVYYYRFYTTNSYESNIAAETSVFMTSEVTVQKTDDADEDGLIPGTFLFSRHPDATNGAITVTYSVGGTAQAGVNYVDNLGTGITFAEGMEQAELVVTPLQDDVSQADETIELSLTGAFHAAGTPSEATMFIFNVGCPDAPTNTWIGAGNASTATNWSLGHAPTADEHVWLSGFSRANMVWDIENGVASWSQGEQYTGTVTIQTVYGAAGFTNFTITGDCVLSNGVWTHAANSNTEQYRLRVSIGGNLIVGTQARIDASGRGYTRWNGPGGHGGRREADQHTYGSCLEPTSLGSHQQPPGGGAVYLTVGGEARVDGQILATGVYDYYGPSHGGSIYLRAGSLSGSGTNSVRGGEIAVNGVGGGGGRLAVILTQSDDFGDVVNTARGGIRTSGQGYDASAGTVYLEGQSESGGGGRLIIDNSSRFYMNRATDIFGSHPTLAVSNDMQNVTLIVTNRTMVALTHDVTVLNAELNTAGTFELAGHTLTTLALTVDGTVYRPGIYTPAEISLLTDGVGGGQVVVYAPKGTLFLIR